eukprot:TRINITY_DN17675_c2_g2_i1.p1 TRINITY_DN17675_c2_g2~~TRINITY_DN17675_c2_g2_i1.p1  ORF type:complete len:148 (+),score=21.51 TRINITY_DN17675_c2_g2_i1:2-445(+)
MPPSGSAPGRRRPNFGRQGRSRLKLASDDLPLSAQSLNELPSVAADAELQEASSSSMSNTFPLRARTRQRQRYLGRALVWSDRQRREMHQTLDFSQLQWQPLAEGIEDEDSDGDDSSCGPEVELDKDPEAIRMRAMLESKMGGRETG